MNNDNDTTKINNVTLEPENKKKYIDMQMPKLQTEQTIINNAKKKKRSIVPFIFILLIIGILVILKNEDITSYINSYSKKNNNINIKEKETNEVIDGYILINSNNSNIVVNDIKFYNFKKDSINSIITYNYSPNKNINEANNIYIEFYDIDKNVLFRDKFNINKTIYNGEIYSNSIEIDSYTYENISYILVRNINETKEDSLTCTYKVNNDNYNLIYVNTYHYNNDFLTYYEVSKKIEVLSENNESKEYINDINNEYNTIKDIDNNSILSNNDLSYKIDLSNINNDFTPLYDTKSSIIVIKNKEILKKWECE